MLASRPDKRSLRRVQAALLLFVCLAFPVAAAFVFVGGFDRIAVANVLAPTYVLGLYGVLSTPWWPLPGLRTMAARERFHEMVMLWLWITYVTHVTWELFWLLLHDAIVVSADAPWAYVWWAYIDGGDLRYASDDPSLWMMELLSVTNGFIGLIGLSIWYRQPHRRHVAAMLFFATAVVHLYSASLYYGGEIVAGLPNVNTASFYDVGVKFIGANSLWLILPWCVIAWSVRQLGPAERTLRSPT